MRSSADAFFEHICTSTNAEDLKHTMCLHNKGPACPSEFAEKRFEQGDKDLMMELSNEKRRSVSLNFLLYHNHSLTFSVILYLLYFIRKICHFILIIMFKMGSSNMRMLTWDDDLATVAQQWADQCENHHEHEPAYRYVYPF